MAYKPFKMKGHALPGIHQNPEGNTDLPDGRSGSSPLQQKKWSDMSDKEKTDLFKVTHRKPENLIEKQKRRMKETQIFSPEQQEKRERASFSKKLHKDIMKAIGKQLKKSPAKKVEAEEKKELSSWDKVINLAKHKDLFMDEKHPQHKEYVAKVNELLNQHHIETGGKEGVESKFTYKGKEY